MTENNKANPGVTPGNAVEIEEKQLDEAAGGASDYLLEIDGIKGETQSAAKGTKPPRASPVLLLHCATGQ